ncbi:MAG: hypothetical protein J6U54_17350 [Clostridiales bacterium]|nr:hypothetical protein [Clostridiales bacterium]
MDIVIKNIECLRNDIDGHTKTPPERVVVDFSKAGTDEFAQLFFDACEEEKLKEVTARMQGEFDATGKDVAYFMNHRVKPGGLNND